MTTEKTHRKKPGPTPTGLGLLRRIPLMLMFEEEEWEYLCRLEERYRKFGERALKKAQIIRGRTFHSGWRDELAKMRQSQGANLP